MKHLVIQVAVAATALLLLDGFMAQSILLSVLFSLVAIGWAGLRWLRNRRTKEFLVVLFGFAACVAAVVVIIQFNNRLSEKRAVIVANAIRAFEEKKGRYPESLEELVPAFLASVPRARLTLVLDSFEYVHVDGQPPFLIYFAQPPFGRRAYRIDTGQWRTVD